MHIWGSKLASVCAVSGLLLTAAAPAVAQGNAAAWTELQRKGKAEGSVVVAGPAVPPLRIAFVEGFKKAYGVDVNYLSLRAGEMITRTETEAKVNKISIDVYIGGSTCWELASKGLADDVSSILVDPDLYKPGIWKDGKPRLVKAPKHMNLPDSFRCFVQYGEWVMTDLLVNTNIIKPGEIKSWKDLLKPQYKGKIVSFDPRRPGPAHTTVGYLASKFGNDYVAQLYSGQEVRLSTDIRQLAEQVARGTYPIGIAIVQSGVETFRREGLPIERLFPEDGPGPVTGGFATAMRTKGAPHPNAAALFINWLASKEAQDAYQTVMMEASLRTDLSTSVPSYVIPKPGVKYDFDSYDPEAHYNITYPAVDKIVERLER